MKKFQIVKDNKKSLRERCLPVKEEEFDEVKSLLLEMIDYLKNSQDEKISEKYNIRPGVGIAAPQIGINKQFFAIYYLDEENKEHVYGFINPKIISESTKLCYLLGGEGCLSVDKEHQGYVYRPYKITIKGFNVVTNKEETKVLTKYEGIVFQHEYDHLKGILFYDHIDKNNPFKIIEGSEGI